jgi:hypothetical protein
MEAELGSEMSWVSKTVNFLIKRRRRGQKRGKLDAIHSWRLCVYCFKFNPLFLLRTSNVGDSLT